MAGSISKMAALGLHSVSRVASRFSSLERLGKSAAALHHAAGRSRWYLLLAVVPKILVCLAVRVVIMQLPRLHVHLRLDFFSPDLVSGFAQSAIFVLAILVSGVLEDYKARMAGVGEVG